MTFSADVPKRDQPRGTPLKLPLLLDTEACALGYYVVLENDYQVLRTFKTIEEAETFIADANGTDVATVQQKTAERAQMLNAYREKLRANRRRTNPSS